MKKIKGIIFDIDGVLIYQGKVYDGAIETIQLLRDRGFVLRFLSNSTLNSRESITEKLKTMGFQISKEEVITASYATALYVKRLKPKSCWILLEGKGLNEFKGFNQDMNNPEYIIMGNNKSYCDFNHLNHVLRLLLKGSKLIAMMPELVDCSTGEIELNVGSFAQMLEKASGKSAIYIGKPNTFMFELSLSSMKLDRDEVVMVGDRMHTDIKGAKNVGIKSILVKTGEFNDIDLNTDIKPNFSFDSIRDIEKIFR